MEQWKRIKGFDRYMISDHGNVISNSSYKKGRLLKPQKVSQKGYYAVRLYTGKDQQYKQCYIHKLVVEHFKRPLSEGEVVHHKDEDIYNNHVDNLGIMTHSEHSALHCSTLVEITSRYSVEDINNMREYYNEVKNTAAVARHFNIPYSSSYVICTKRVRKTI